MKCIYLSLFLIITISSFCNGQDLWFNEGSTWVHRCLVPSANYQGFYETKYEKDTIIDGQNCAKLSRYFELFEQTILGIEMVDAGTDNPLFMYATPDNEQVYIYQENNFKLLFDFSLQPGDILNMPVPEVALAVEELCPISSYQVDSIGTEIINDVSLKWISVSPTSDSNYSMTGKIYQKIGSVEFYFYPLILDGLCPMLSQDFNFYDSFRCYKDNSFEWFSDQENLDCYFPGEEPITSTNSSTIVPVPNTIEIYPNPSTDLIEISSIEKIGEIFIYDSIGRIINKINVLDTNTEVNLNGLSSGLYYIYSVDRNTSYKILKM